MEGGFCLTSAPPLTPWATLSTREGKPPVLMYSQGYTFWIILALAAAVFLAGQGTSFLASLQLVFFFFFFLAVQCSMWDLSFLPRD